MIRFLSKIKKNKKISLNETFPWLESIEKNKLEQKKESFSFRKGIFFLIVTILFLISLFLFEILSYSVILSIFDNDKNINEINIKDKLIIIKVVTLL